MCTINTQQQKISTIIQNKSNPFTMATHGPYNPPSDTRACLRYHRQRMMGRPISEGREVHLHRFPRSRFVDHIQRLGWSAFMLVGGTIYPQLVEEFYSHFAYDLDDGTVIFTMFDTIHHYTLSDFGELLGVPCVEDAIPDHLNLEDLWIALCRPEIPYPELGFFDNIRDDYLQAQFVVPGEIIRSNVFHRESSNATLFLEEQRVLYSLSNNIPVNMARVVATRMNRLHYDLERPLPYGALLTPLFRRIGAVRDGIPNHPISTRPITGVIEISSSEDDSGTSSTRSDARSYRRRR